VRHHHEAWDGSGYPAGLAGLDIPFGARVIAVADSYDAMTSDRPYRAGMPQAKAVSILRAGRGQQWDPTLVDAFLRALGAQEGLRPAPATGGPRTPRRRTRCASRHAPANKRLSRAQRQAWAVEHLRTAGPLSPRAYATALAISGDTALRDLQELVDRRRVQATGTTKDRRYVLAGEAVGPAIHRTAP
jgi:hypothetical protein